MKPKRERRSAHFSAQWVIPSRNPIRFHGVGELQASEVRTRLGNAQLLHFTHPAVPTQRDPRWMQRVGAVGGSRALRAGLGMPGARTEIAEVRNRQLFCSGDWRRRN